MSLKKLPLETSRMLRAADECGTPFHLYDWPAIEKNARGFLGAFSWAPGFTNCFAVKACPNMTILSRLAKLGFGADCASLPELRMALKAGFPAERIVFTSNDTPDKEFLACRESGAVMNLDDISFIEDVERVCGKLPDTICFRFNPGPERTGNAIIGNPVEAKYGLTRDQVFEAYRISREKGVKTFGLHTMVASNELNGAYIIETARMLFSLALEIREKTGVEISFLDLGGGIGIPYRPEDEAMDLAAVSEGIRELYEAMLVPEGLRPRLMFECGRMVTGPYGYLVARVRHVTRKYKDYVGLDACMADLMRPGMYGSYHHITVVGKEDLPKDHVYDVTGSLCENNDKFAVDRELPEVEKGDVLVIHDAGAHGHSMGFNYNGKLRHAEWLLEEDGSLLMVRRAETYEDYTKTMAIEGLEAQP